MTSLNGSLPELIYVRQMIFRSRSEQPYSRWQDSLVITLIKNFGVSKVSPPTVWEPSELELIIVILDDRLKSSVYPLSHFQTCSLTTIWPKTTLKRLYLFFLIMNKVSVMNEIPYLSLYWLKLFMICWSAESILTWSSDVLRAFTSLCYSADGESMLAGGHSKFVCIYNIKEQILMKKFEISCNMSLDAMEVLSLLIIIRPLLILTCSFMCQISCNSDSFKCW